MTKEELLNKVSKLIVEYENDGHDNSVGCFIYFDDFADLHEYDGEKFASLPSWKLKKVPKPSVVLQNHDNTITNAENMLVILGARKRRNGKK